VTGRKGGKMSQGMDEHGPSWREVVQEAAYEAAVAETRARQNREEILFNYRWEHVRSVVRQAVRLGELLGADMEVVEAAAWLHDVAKGQGEDHGKEGAVLAQQILSETDFPQAKIPSVADAITKHVGLWVRKPVEPLEAAILWDADKLSKLGATSVLHFVGYFASTGPSTTEHILERMLDTDWQERTLGSFHTAPAREAAERRRERFQEFCRQAARELEAQDL
jgi:uncharacterized protein